MKRCTTCGSTLERHSCAHVLERIRAERRVSGRKLRKLRDGIRAEIGRMKRENEG